MFQQMVFIAVCMNTFAEANLYCLFCNEAVSPTNCDTVVRCGEHERCYVDAYASPSGTLRYNLGCRDENMCRASPSVRKRDVLFTTTNGEYTRTALDAETLVSPKAHHTFWSGTRDISRKGSNDSLICSECCTGNLCGSAACGYNGYAATRGPICFNCAEQLTPGDCSKIKQCGQDEVCMLLKTLDPMTHEVRYKSECSTEKTCQSKIQTFKEMASLLVGKRRQRKDHLEIGGSCLVQCCKTDMCNVNCGNVTFLNSTPPMTSSSTRPPTQTPSTKAFSGQPVVTTIADCKDKLSTCGLLDTSFYCSGQFYNFALENCQKTCNLCTEHAFSGQPVVTTIADCKDKLSTCGLLDTSFYCSGQFYSYALENCQKTCNLCTEHATTTPIPPVTVNSSVWLLFLKGVAGAPGPDLYQLWYSSQTLNLDVPEAKTLTATFKGHYKPDFSNHWKDLCIDQVKVAIYNQGVEKANIIFNAIGADKNSWFTPDRIISSTWTDIKTAQKQIFSIAGDANSGREFYISGHSSSTDSCDSFGWIMVSIKSSCFFEAGDKKPSFYYAPGTSQAHWGITKPGTGDVFAIQAHSQCPGQVTSQPLLIQTPVCDYKGKQYTQGQFWQDGCQYNCTCVDASIGYYRCRNLCPHYTNLPPGCKLFTKPGACCAEPDKDLNCAGTITVPTPLIISREAAFCVHKGQYYTQDQTWKDGCSQLYACTNADQGIYSCRDVCLNWNTLPPVCHLEDLKPGLCCQQPKCPPYIVINIPKAYKDEYPDYTYI